MALIMGIYFLTNITDEDQSRYKRHMAQAQSLGWGVIALVIGQFAMNLVWIIKIEHKKIKDFFSKISNYFQKDNQNKKTALRKHTKEIAFEIQLPSSKAKDASGRADKQKVNLNRQNMEEDKEDVFDKLNQSMSLTQKLAGDNNKSNGSEARSDLESRIDQQWQEINLEMRDKK